MKTYWKEYLSYSRRDRRGIFVLLMIIFIQISVLSAMHFFPGADEANLTELNSDSLFLHPAKNSISGFHTLKTENSKHRFTSDNHILKPQTTKHKPQTTIPRPILELNTADSLQLLALKCIGPVFSSRIIKYRNLLGGFYSAEQVKEVYGIDSALFLKILPQLTADANAVKKININTADIDELKKHPYLRYKIARAIINHRNRFGDFSELSELKNIPEIDEQIYSKIQPYLSIN
jgi:DNA uptake protein ComE-like DNA-binding protein